MKELLKTLAPIIGGLIIGDSVSTIGTRPVLGVLELILGMSFVAYTFYLIFKKWQELM